MSGGRSLWGGRRIRLGRFFLVESLQGCHMRCTSIWLFAVSLLVIFSTSPPLAAQPLNANDKLRFLESICQNVQRESRCLNSGKLVLGLSIGWIMFEGCSASGEVETIVACFDKASLLAAELTGDQGFHKQSRHCHRFQGDHTEDAIVRCYREGFKYSVHTLKKYHGQSPEPSSE